MDTSTLSSTFVIKVPQNTTGQYLILKTEWRSDDVNLQILDNHKSKEWQGNISLDDLKQSAEELEISYDTFLNECKEALTTNGGVEHFEYLLENDKFNLIKKDQFQIKYFELDLKENTDLKSNFALAAVDLIASLRTELATCKEKSNELDSKYQTMVKTMEKCLEEKNQLEKNLLQKFAVLLNTKKDKIAELQDLVVEKNKLLDEAGLLADETAKADDSNKRKSTDLVVNEDDDDEDFMQPTQVMTQPVSRTLPKRVKT